MLYVPCDRWQKLSQTCIPLHGQEEFQIYYKIEKNLIRNILVLVE